ncbi:MAG: ABC transporter permease, partial [Clostridium sp.]|nr:ABC transporter permease [Clostridium sp.]
MLQYELKKFFSKKMNKAILTALFLIALLVSFLAAGSMGYTDTGEEIAAGIGKIAVGRRLAADKNKWKGELTPEKIADAAKSYYEMKQAYQEEIPNLESERAEPPLDILHFANGIYQTKDDVVLAGLEHLVEEDFGHIYDTYVDNLQNMAKEYGETPEQEKLLKEQFKKTETPIAYEAYDSWKTMAEDAELYILVLVVVIGFLAAGIIDEEFQNHAERVFFTTKYGR